ncbi:MAG: hypothetical protein WCP20_21480 [Desulfuromonadales bacterium]
MKHKSPSDIEKVEVLPPLKKVRSLPLTTVGHCRSELATVYRMAKAGELELNAACKFAYILIALGKMIETSDMESRLEALEEQNIAKRRGR